MIEVITALPTSAWETPLVTALGKSSDVVVVRRCVDLADVLAVASAGLARAVLLSGQLRRLDADAIDRLHAAGVAIVGISAPGASGDGAGAGRLRELGVEVILPADAPGDRLVAAVLEAVARSPRTTPSARRHPGASSTAELPPAGSPARASASRLAFAEPLRSLPDLRLVTEADAVTEQKSGAPGRLIAVWGPVGSPGRTSIAIALAGELAERGHDALVADADTRGSSVAQLLGLLDESSGLAAAVRLAGTGSLDLTALARLAPVVAPHLRVLTGVARADRWSELRPTGLEHVWSVARRLCSVVVADVSDALEQDEELSFDTAAPRRNGAAIATLLAADEIIAVCAATPVGVQRFARGLHDLRELAPSAPVRVVVNRVRAAAVGRQPEQQLTDALDRYCAVTSPFFVPDDSSAFDAAQLQGLTLAEAAPRSAARRALAALALAVAGQRHARPTATGRPRRRA